MIRRILFVAICLVIVTLCRAHAHDVKEKYVINEIVKEDTAKGISIKYPVFTYKNQIVSSKINAKIKDFFYDYGSVGDLNVKLNSAIDSAIAVGMTDLYADVPFCNNDLLSVELHCEGMGAYPSWWTEYYNFSGYGNLLTIDSLIDPSKMNDFKLLLAKKQDVNIKEAIADFKERLKSNEIDSDEFNDRLNDVATNCMENYSPSKFFISDTGITVIIDCEFPHVIQSMNPDTDVVFSKKDLEKMIRKNYHLQ